MEFNSNTSCIIEKSARQNKKSCMLNINTRFRKNYYSQSSTDFQIDLPYTIGNVINMTLDSFECTTKLYTFSTILKTNEFTIETYEYNIDRTTNPPSEKRSEGPKNVQKYVIKIKDGSYTGKQLEEYLNLNVFAAELNENMRYRNVKDHFDRDSDLWKDDDVTTERTRVVDANVIKAFTDADDDAENIIKANPVLNLTAQQIAETAPTQGTAVGGGVLNEAPIFNAISNNDPRKDLKRVICKFDEPSGKFIFWRDVRAAGGLPDTNEKSYKFNLKWTLDKDPNRPIQFNLGWILGFRKQYYNIDDYIIRQKITYDKFSGFNPECQYKGQSTEYVLLSLNDYGKSKGDTVLSPFEESSFADGDILAKLPVIDNKIIYRERAVDKIYREYYGPINLKKLKVRLLDEFGRTVDLQNSDYSFSLKLQMLYD
jgi:hypothetical protein